MCKAVQGLQGNHDRLKLRLENALSAVEAATIEARRRVRLNEGR